MSSDDDDDDDDDDDEKDALRYVLALLMNVIISFGSTRSRSHENADAPGITEIEP